MSIPAYYDAPDLLEGSVPMRGDDPRHESMFSYVTPEARVRADHPLRPIRRMTDAALQRLSPRFDRLYSTIGRPSIPPEKLLRALLLQMLYSIRSERLLMEELDYSVLYRWFVGLSLDDPIWDATTFTKNRDRLLDGDIADAFFAEVLAAIKAGRAALGRALHGRRHAARGVGESQELQTEGHRGPPPDDPKNPTVNFHGQTRRNDTHQSTTDPDARLYKKAVGREAKLGYLGASAHRESPRLHRRHGGDGGDRHGRTRRRDRDARRAAADDAGASRSAPTKRTTRAPGSPPSDGMRITPHVAQNEFGVRRQRDRRAHRRDTPGTAQSTQTETGRASLRLDEDRRLVPQTPPPRRAPRRLDV